MSKHPPNWLEVTVRLSDLKPWGHNPKTSTKKDAKALIDGWESLGQFQPIAIGPGCEVYDGHQRLSALLTVYGPDYEIRAWQADRLLTDDERHEIALRSRQIGAWNWDELANWQPSELVEWGGFDVDTLKTWKRDTTALQNFIFSNEETPDFKPVSIDEQGRLDQKKPITCPECGHEFTP